MAFGFFKKAESADIIFTNGKVYTQSNDNQWVDAVAVKDGRIMALGDEESILELEGDETEVVDMEGGIMLPGFIDTHGQPVNRAFAGQFLSLFDMADIDEVILALGDYIEEWPDKDIYFAVGFHEKILLPLNQEERRELLDRICGEKPVIALSESGIGVWINTKAVQMIQEAAEEDKMLRITLPYILSVLGPVDFEQAEEKVMEIAGEYCERGFTSVMDCGGDDYFHSVYQDILMTLAGNDMLKQRFFGSLLVNRLVEPASVVDKLRRKRTTCVEVEWGIEFNNLRLMVPALGKTGEEEAGEEDGIELNAEGVKALCLAAADAGFNVHIEVSDEEGAFAAVAAMEAAMGAGYKKNTFILAHEESLDGEFIRDTAIGEGIIEAAPSAGDITDKWRVIENAKNVSEAIDMLTIDGAAMIGKENELGSIDVGKCADLVIFDENPLEAPSISALKKIQAVMTVVNGQIAYDAQEGDRSQWYTLMNGMQF